MGKLPEAKYKRVNAQKSITHQSPLLRSEYVLSPSRSNWWLAVNRDCYYGIEKDKRTERAWDLIVVEKNREDIKGHQYKGTGPKDIFFR